VLTHCLGVHLHDVVECKKSQILQILVGVFDEGSELGDTQAHERDFVRQTNDACLEGEKKR